MTHIDAGVWISLPKYDWHYAVIMSRHVTHVTCHTCHKCVMRIIRHYLSTLRSLSRYHSLFELVLSSVPWSHIVLFIPRWPRPLLRSCSVEAPVTEPTKVRAGGIKLFKSEFYSSAGLYKWMFCFRVCRHKNPREEDPRDAGKVSEGAVITICIRWIIIYFRCGISTGKCEKECASVTVLEHTECGCDCGELRYR